MDRSFQSGASGSAPVAPANPSIGYPTAGNPGGGTPPTKPGPYWYHMITEELRAVIAAAGVTPSQADLSQLLQALPGALASRPEMARSFAANGYQKFPGGLIVQWGVTTTGTSSPTTVTLPVAFPNAIFAAYATANTAVNQVATVPSQDKGSIQVDAWLTHTASRSSTQVRWLAIGW